MCSDVRTLFRGMAFVLERVSEALSGLGGGEWELSGPRTGSDRVLACFFTEDLFFTLLVQFILSNEVGRYEFTLPRRRVSFCPWRL